MIYYNKKVNGRAHFTTWHGVSICMTKFTLYPDVVVASKFFGILTVFWLLGQIFVGAGSVWFGGALFGGGMQAKSLWKYHR